MKLYKLTAVFVPEKNAPGVYNASVPALPGCLSFGDSLEEARFNIREALELYLMSVLDDGEPIPKDKKIKLPKGAIQEEVAVAIDFEIKTESYQNTPRKKSLASYAK